jgi:hypothetical protein
MKDEEEIMNTKFFAAALAALVMATPVMSRAAGNTLPAGKYVATLSPAPTEAVADKIESEVGKIQGLRMIDVKPEQGSLHFTVRDGSAVSESDIQNAVKAAAPDTEVGQAVSEQAPSGSGSGVTTPSTGY